MCCGDSGFNEFEKAMRFQRYFRALHCPTRWSIIRIIGEDEKGTGEILEGLRDMRNPIARSSLYYHISELEKAGIIEMVGYKEEGGGAPEEVWRLKVREVKINLLEGVDYN
jgi:DNA-binding transcriptional ArsR family regulator